LLDTLLDVAGPSGMIQVSVRIFPEHAEIDVLPATLIEPAMGAVAASGNGTGAERACVAAGNGAAAGNGRGPAAANGNGNGAVRGPGAANGHGADGPPPTSFAEWFAAVLRREGMTMEAVARRLQVSVKTVSRWVGGTTEPRLRDLSRIREIFGELPFP
jgi:hypothetical protein